MKVYKRYKNPISCIYMITCNNYCYIGSAKVFSKRKFEHLWNLRNNRHTNPILQNLFNKYGANSLTFSIKEVCKPEVLIEREQYWIDNIPDNINKINIAMVAGSTLGVKPTIENIEKRRASMIGKNKGIPRTKEVREKISKKLKGREISKEWKDKISKTMMGRKSNGRRPLKIAIKYNKKLYTYQEFADLIGLSLEYVRSTGSHKKSGRHISFEKKYKCKFI